MTRTSVVITLTLLALFATAGFAGFAWTRGGAERGGAAPETAVAAAQDDVLDAVSTDASVDPQRSEPNTCDVGATASDAGADMVPEGLRAGRRVRAPVPSGDPNEPVSFGLMRMERDIPFAP